MAVKSLLGMVVTGRQFVSGVHSLPHALHLICENASLADLCKVQPVFLEQARWWLSGYAERERWLQLSDALAEEIEMLSAVEASAWQ